MSCGNAAQELFSVRVRELGPGNIVIDGFKKLNDAISLPLRKAHAHEGLLASIVGHLNVLHSLTGGLSESHGYISLGGGLAHDVVSLAVVGRVLSTEQDVGTNLSDIADAYTVIRLGGSKGV